MMLTYRSVFVLLLIFTLGCSGKRKETAHHSPKDTVSALVNSPSRFVASSQRAIRTKLNAISSSSILKGVIGADETRHNKVAVRVGGRIEKLYTRFSFQLIQQGSPVMEIYSPELNSAAEEYLLLLKSHSGKELLDESFKKLKLMGLNESQIRALERKGNVPLTFTVFSPYSGYLLGPDELQGNTQKDERGEGSDMNEMSADASSQESYSGTVIREGAYVNKGQTIFLVNDLRFVWALLTIDPGMNATKGDSVFIYYKDSVIKEKLDFIEPYFQQEQKFSRARVSLKNDGNFKLNDLFTAELKQESSKDILTVPVKSVLDLGQRKIVWVKKEKAGENYLFESRTVVTGQVIGDNVEILEGLSPGDEIAEVAGFMLDSESLIEK